MKTRLSLVPARPGVYILKDHKDKVLYVGKAKKLRNRLRTYFQRSAHMDMRKSSMVKLITDFSYIITENELEALILEANLIKQHNPRFNVILRDDKNYPYLKLTTNEKWPRLEVTRRITKNGSIYFGPYVPAQSMWDAIAFIRKTFPIRTCKHSLDKPMRPCIQFQMNRCAAPCAGMINRDEYLKVIDEVRLFLSGDRKELIKNLEDKMIKLSDELRFEEAAKIRDRLRGLSHIWELQRVISPELGDIDVIGSHSDSIDIAFNVFFIRNGILTGTKDFYLRDAGRMPYGELIHGFIEMFYSKEIIPPDEVIVRQKPDDARNLRAWLTARKGRKVAINIPREGKRVDVLDMADENAAQIFNSKRISAAGETLNEVKDRLNLPSLPAAIGAFDVSTTSGSESVGAFIFWREGSFIKDMYRHLKIKTVSGIDDYSMMNEVITRTLKNIGDNMPDLIIIDGGKGQLETARDAIEANRTTSSDGKQPMIVAVAKDPDRVFTLDSEVIDLEDRNPSSLLLKKIRDEAHRFAVTYHRKLRDKSLTESPLERIRGIGKKRRLELLRYFGSIDAIRSSSIDEIRKLKGFDTTFAEKILSALRRAR